MLTLLLSEHTPSGSQIWTKETQNRWFLLKDSPSTLLIYSVLFQAIFKIWSMRRVYQCLYSIGGRTLEEEENKFMRQVYKYFVTGTNMVNPSKIFSLCKKSTFFWYFYSCFVHINMYAVSEQNGEPNMYHKMFVLLFVQADFQCKM